MKIKADFKKQSEINDELDKIQPEIFSDDIWIASFEFLSIHDVPKISLVSKKINCIQDNSYLWKIYAQRLNLTINNTTHPKQQIKEQLIISPYRDKNPLFAALEPILPYHMYKRIPDLKTFIPKKVASKLIDTFRAEKYIELRDEIRDLPVFKDSEDLIRFNVTNQKNTKYPIWHSLEYNTYKKKFTWSQNTSHRSSCPDPNNQFSYTTTDSNTHKTIIEYLSRLLRREPCGPLDIKYNGNGRKSNEVIEEEPKIINGKSTIELFPDKDMKVIQEKDTRLRNKYAQYYDNS